MIMTNSKHQILPRLRSGQVNSNKIQNLNLQIPIRISNFEFRVFLTGGAV